MCSIHRSTQDVLGLPVSTAHNTSLAPLGGGPGGDNDRLCAIFASRFKMCLVEHLRLCWEERICKDVAGVFTVTVVAQIADDADIVAVRAPCQGDVC